MTLTSLVDSPDQGQPIGNLAGLDGAIFRSFPEPLGGAPVRLLMEIYPSPPEQAGAIFKQARLLLEGKGPSSLKLEACSKPPAAFFQPLRVASKGATTQNLYLGTLDANKNSDI
eukprot:s16_g15.t1